MSSLLLTCPYWFITTAAICFPGHGPSSKVPAKETAKVSDRHRVAKLIESLASRNKPPAIKLARPGDERGRAVFPEKYDWKEQSRVFAAVYALFKDESVEGWEEVLKHVDDARYCVTLALDAEANWARNFSVGDICRSMAHAELYGVLTKRIPNLYGRPFKVRLDADLAEWRKRRANKPLYELQIELCEVGRTKAASLKGVSEEERVKLDEGLERAIKELKRTKRHVSSRSTLFVFYTDIWHPDRPAPPEQGPGLPIESLDVIDPVELGMGRNPYQTEQKGERSLESGGDGHEVRKQKEQ